MNEETPETYALKAQDAIDTLTEEGWIWDGDQWQRPPNTGVNPT